MPDLAKVTRPILERSKEAMHALREIAPPGSVHHGQAEMIFRSLADVAALTVILLIHATNETEAAELLTRLTAGVPIYR